MDSPFYSNLRSRVTTAAFLVLLFGLIEFAAAHTCLGRWLLLTAGLLTALGSGWEFATLSSASVRLPEGRNFRRAVYFAGMFLPSLSVFVQIIREGLCAARPDPLLQHLIACLAGIVMSSMGALLYMQWRGRQSLHEAGTVAQELIPSILLIGVGAGMLLVLAAHDQGHLVILWLVLVVCVNDIAAYFGGTLLGGPRLAPVISPKKTLSGSLAGLVGGSFSGFLCGPYFLPGVSFSTSFAIALVVVVAAQLGDLGKSFVKRLHNVKDSGSLLPGHGGVLDRVDGILAAAPLLFLALVIATVQPQSQSNPPKLECSPQPEGSHSPTPVQRAN